MFTIEINSDKTGQAVFCRGNKFKHSFYIGRYHGDW